MHNVHSKVLLEYTYVKIMFTRLVKLWKIAANCRPSFEIKSAKEEIFHSGSNGNNFS